ncbi:SRPBCC domain-containing protein [Dyadobacter sp. LJ53]|uniref:SRPBCC family protein n=1 Tax=Dyadobacter chenwenxiniae TaxID=2906456 RepID=UPI001F44B0AB|nr:SRPBCC domain-containing protein [Dyadobacter chenwenxiniae]MCF0052153.1 SRPBCC domain-containing protein [Dyadobacter chenwenxiniae]
MEQQTQKRAGLKIVREFKAPKTLVFDAFASPESFGEWWGPAGSQLSVLRFDFRTGGSTHYKMEGNGHEMWGLFQYKNIRRADLLEFVNSFADAEGNIITSPFPMDFPLEVFNQITLEEKDGITTLTIQGHPIHATTAQEETYFSIMDNMQEGFSGTFDKLDAYLEKVQG